MNKKEISRILRVARDLMNDGGKHWIKKKTTKKLKNGERAYCSIGAINAAMGVPKNGNNITKTTRPVALALANQIRAERGWKPFPSYVSNNDIAYTIWSYNDKKFRVWDDVKRVFTKAAKKPVMS